MSRCYASLYEMEVIKNNKWTALMRIMNVVNITRSGCWILEKKPTNSGYVRFKINSKSFSAHRFMFFLFRDETPNPSLVLDHLCKNKTCCNPSHLRQIDYLYNLKIGRKERRIDCEKGHPYVDGSYYLSNNGIRICKECCKIRYIKRRGPLIVRDKSRCGRGHKYTKSNTYIMKNGHRACIECKRIVYKKYLPIIRKKRRDESRRKKLRNV